MIASPTPRFTIQEATHLARSLYALTATAAPLPSERDQNFLLTTTSGERFVLKIANAEEAPSNLDFQNAALRHVSQREPRLAISRVLLTTGGDDKVVVPDAAGRSFWLRLVTWLEGTILVHARPHDPALLASLGDALARLDGALADFRHSGMDRQLHWDLRHIQLALEHLPLLDPGERTIMRRFRTEWEAVDWASLRTCVIHGDANDYNVLVRGGEVVGFLDFGDMVRSALVCDLAIALAYAMLDKPDPIECALLITAAYHRRHPLQPAELAALYPLMLSRLSMSVLYAAYNARAKSGDDYQLVTAAPAWKLLRQLAEVSVDRVTRRLREVTTDA